MKLGDKEKKEEKSVEDRKEKIELRRMKQRTKKLYNERGK